MASKSIFLNSVTTGSKSVINPVIGPGDLSLIDTLNYGYMTTIEEGYGTPLSIGDFPNIYNNFKTYINLYYNVTNLIGDASDPRMLILLRLVRDLLMGAFRVYDLNQTKDSYLIDKINLQQQILEILSNKNNAYVDLVGGTGQLSVTKSFKLAPVYNYYISIFGMPQNRAGFDPVKLKYLDDILTKKGITP